MPIANIIAVVAVLEIHAEMNAVTAPKAKRMRVGEEPTQRIERTPNARRRSRPWMKIARAMMNEPMNRNINWSANGAKTSFAGATRRSTHRAAPSSAVIGIGSASVIQRRMTVAVIAASRWASGFSPGIGISRSRPNTTGAATSPAVFRMRSNHASASVKRSTGGGGGGGGGDAYGAAGALLGSCSMKCGHSVTLPGAAR
jgi:hypothetical protein